MKLLSTVIACLFGANAYAGGDYCLALRGNGELAPAHWGALGNLVEKMGLPAKQAGGSSASITMMMNEAVASNFLVRDSQGDMRNLRASMLIKSLEGFADHLQTTDDWKDFLLLTQLGTRSREWLSSLKSELGAALKKTPIVDLSNENLELIKRNFRTGIRLGLIGEKNYAPLIDALVRITQRKSENIRLDLETAYFYASELHQAISVFGSFDAETDVNLFFRPGIVDFGRFALQAGRVATFYSTIGAGDAEVILWKKLSDTCAQKSQGLTWNELTQAFPECGAIFGKLIAMHFASEAKPNFAELTPGIAIDSLPTTSVLVGAAAALAREKLVDYGVARNAKFGLDFKIANTDEIKFGYWGDPMELARIERALVTASDEKSRRFMSLGRASWQKILSLSPAEPGLAALQPFELADGEKVVSAGGWSDLHPVLVLKAAGCLKVVYVTRRGGESVFGQGVAKRLLNLDRAWDKIKNTRLNNAGDAGDMTSLWSKLYNLANRESSFNQALQNADAVLCTDWNRFAITNGIRDLVKDAFKSPFFVQNRSAFAESTLIPELNKRDMHPDGYPIYAGCFAP